MTSRARDLIAGAETPFVLLDRIFEGTHADAVGVDNAEASESVIHRLIGFGHRRILVAYLGDGIDNVSERLEGVRRAARDAGDRVTVDYLPTGTSVERARLALAVYLDANPAPDAVFCLFNTATLAAYGLLLERGLEPGRRTALVGFDDSAWMAHVHPPVGAIVQPVRKIAEQAWARILSRIEGDDSPGQVLRLSCRLEPRGSLETTSEQGRSRGGAVAQAAAPGK
jgi:DNA-binding LacI/PurR family transcriptional regulator